MDYHNDREIVETFIAETQDHLAEIEAGILQLEKGESDPAGSLVHGMFRAAHSIKAGANLLELHNIEALSHALENTLQQLRRGRLTVDGDTATILLQSVDRIGELLQNLEFSDMARIEFWVEKLTSLSQNRDGT